MKHFFGNAFIGIVLVFVFSSCASRIVDYGYPQSGIAADASLVVLKDYETVGIIIVKSTEMIDNMGNHTGSKITFEMLMLEAQKLRADDIINLRVDVQQKEEFSDTGKLEKITYNYTGTALAIKYTKGIIPETRSHASGSAAGGGANIPRSTSRESSTEKYANVRSNWLSGGPIGAGAGLMYERMLGRNLSVGADIYYMFYGIIVYQDFGLNAKARFYPWGKTFYLGAALGLNSCLVWHNNDGDSDDDEGENRGGYSSKPSFAFSPEFGWRIDVGKPGGGFVDFGVKVPMPFGGDIEDIIFAPYIGFGGAF
jgi:uncharacterized protein YbjQ (UPF0145 family)